MLKEATMFEKYLTMGMFDGSETAIISALIIYMVIAMLLNTVFMFAFCCSNHVRRNVFLCDLFSFFIGTIFTCVSLFTIIYHAVSGEWYFMMLALLVADAGALGLYLFLLRPIISDVR